MSVFIKRRIVSQETLGERLRKVREGMGLSLGEIEKRINVGRDYLEALEAGNYNLLPGEVYVKNFLKTYGSFLGLVKEEVIAKYEEEERVFQHLLMDKCLLGSRDLFGNKVGGKIPQAPAHLGVSLRGVALSSIFKKLIVIGLVVVLFGCLGYEVRKIFVSPDLTISAPADNLITAEYSVAIIGEATPGATVTINNQEVSYLVEGRFEEVIDLKPGLNEIKISALKSHSRPKVVYRRIMVME